MVHGVEDFAIHGLFELLQINHESRARIDFALHRDFEDIIVPMSIWVIAFAEQPPVLLRRERRIVIVVRSSEFSFASEIEQRVTFVKLPASCCIYASSPRRVICASGKYLYSGSRREL